MATNGTVEMNGIKQANGNIHANCILKMNGTGGNINEMNCTAVNINEMNGLREKNIFVKKGDHMTTSSKTMNEKLEEINGNVKFNDVLNMNGSKMETRAKSNILSGPEELELPQEISLSTFILNKLTEQGNKVALIDGVTGETLTYAAILTKSGSVAQALLERGVKQGDVIGMCSENRIDYCLPVIGALTLGATIAPINPIYTTREMIHALNISKPTIVFCSPSAVARITAVSEEVTSIQEIVVFDAAEASVPTGDSSKQEHTPFSTFLQDSCPTVTSDELVGNDRVASIFCSSGTTGLPKGVMTTERNILTGIGHMGDPRFAALSDKEIYLAILPFFHAYGFTVNLTALCIGMQTVILPRFGEEIFLKSIQNYKVTLMFLVPPLLIFLAKHPLVSKYDLSSLRVIWSSAAPLSEEVETQVKKRINMKNIRQGYGLTETTLGVLLSVETSKPGSTGILVPSIQCKVADMTTGEALGPNTNGELCFRGPLIMKGYCCNDEATKECIDEQGFLHTGDIGYYDDDECFFIVGRLKELIKYKGNQVPPAELEAVLLTHPSIKDAAVIGIPNEEAGELPLAFVVLQPDKQLTAEEVTKFVASQVSPAKRLRGGVRFLDVIPKNPSGKILRRVLITMI